MIFRHPLIFLVAVVFDLLPGSFPGLKNQASEKDNFLGCAKAKTPLSMHRFSGFQGQQEAKKSGKLCIDQADLQPTFLSSECSQN